MFDDLHTQPNRALFDVMNKDSGDARTQPLYFLITTAGTKTHSICYEQHQKAQDILDDKKIGPTFYPVICGVGRGKMRIGLMKLCGIKSTPPWVSPYP